MEEALLQLPAGPRKALQGLICITDVPRQGRQLQLVLDLVPLFIQTYRAPISNRENNTL